MYGDRRSATTAGGGLAVIFSTERWEAAVEVK